MENKMMADLPVILIAGLSMGELITVVIGGILVRSCGVGGLIAADRRVAEALAVHSLMLMRPLFCLR